MDHENTILITGASGLLGRSLKAPLEVVGNVVAAGFSRVVEGMFPVDLRHPEALKGLIREVNPDVVVHSAAYRDPDFCEEDPDEAFRLNVAPVARLCELLPASVPLLFISSDYVFDGNAPPYREEDERHPVCEYGRLKVEAEDLVLQRDAGVVLRIPLLIGAGPTWESSGFISKTVAQIEDPTPSSLDHVGIRFPTWIEDVAEAVTHLLGIGARGIFHYSSLEGGTKYEWAMELAELAGLSMEHISPDREGVASRAARPKNTQLAVEKIRDTGLSRFTPFREVARSVMEGFSR
jgi:dTDP-4-dehydrorhamnose reductase